MKIVIFDLGNTLEHNDKLITGAFETLSNIQKMYDDKNQPVMLALISDFLQANSQDEIKEIKEKERELAPSHPNFLKNGNKGNTESPSNKIQSDHRKKESRPEKFSDALEFFDEKGKVMSWDKRKSSIVELHYFGGLTYDEIAETLSISAATVARELNFAKSWLYKELANPTAES